MNTKIKNSFNLSEWSGAVGDLGTLLPIAFALIVMNGYSPMQLFLLWGIVYVISGWYFKVPVSVQPLKAMAVIALAKGYSPEFISSTAFFYGLFFIVLSTSGLINWLQKWFSPSLVRGIQLGIGLILAKKAIELVIEKGFLLNHHNISQEINLAVLIILSASIYLFQIKKKFPLTLVLITISILIVNIMGVEFNFSGNMNGINLVAPDIFNIWDGLIFLMLPQLPLTLGNAVFAANDICHTTWGKQAGKVNPKRLSFSIGLGDTIIGLLGGFPMCHGAGGMGAHAQFGAKTGGATIIIGSLLILSALITPISIFIFLIPVPLLAAMLLFDSYRMAIVVKKLHLKIEIISALAVGIISFVTNNISIALFAGLSIEHGYKYFAKRSNKISRSEA